MMPPRVLASGPKPCGGQLLLLLFKLFLDFGLCNVIFLPGY